MEICFFQILWSLHVNSTSLPASCLAFFFFKKKSSPPLPALPLPNQKGLGFQNLGLFFL